MKSKEDIKESEIEKLIWGKNIPKGFKYSEEQESGKTGFAKKKANFCNGSNRLVI